MTVSCSSNPSRIYIKDSNYTSASTFKAHMAGKTVHFVLATPVQSSITPSAITLQNGENVVMQTDGGRTLAELALTYENLPSES